MATDQCGIGNYFRSMAATVSAVWESLEKAVWVLSPFSKYLFSLGLVIWGRTLTWATATHFHKFPGLNRVNEANKWNAGSSIMRKLMTSL